MKSFVLFYVLAIGTLAGCCGVLRAVTPARSTGDERSATVQISIRCADAPGVPLKWGSGVVVSANQVLTAAHVVTAQCERTVVYASQPDNIGRRMRIELISLTADVARLRIADDGEFADLTPSRIAPPTHGEFVCISTGVPRRDIHCGALEERFDKRMSGDLSISIPVEHGNSGSGLYDRRGRLLGIVTEQRRNANDQSVGGLATAIAGREWLLNATVSP